MPSCVSRHSGSRRTQHRRFLWPWLNPCAVGLAMLLRAASLVPSDKRRRSTGLSDGDVLDDDVSYKIGPNVVRDSSADRSRGQPDRSGRAGRRRGARRAGTRGHREVPALPSSRARWAEVTGDLPTLRACLAGPWPHAGQHRPQLPRSRQGEDRHGNDARVQGEKQPIPPPPRHTPYVAYRSDCDGPRVDLGLPGSSPRSLAANLRP